MLDEKKAYIQSIADEAGFPIEDVHALLYGKIPRNYNSEHIKLIQTLAKDGRGIIIGVVWQGEAEPQQLRNSPVYYYLGQLIEGLDISLHKYGYTSQLFFSNEVLADDDYFEHIFSLHPDVGFINFAFLSDKMREIYQKHNRPVVYIDYPVIDDVEQAYIIALDTKAVFEEAVAYLHDLGHERIAFIKSPQHKLSFVARYEGYCEGLEQMGLSVDDDLIFQGDWYEVSGEAAARHFLALKSPPTAIIASNDLMALGAMRVIQGMGYTIPDDISIIGFDDIAAASQATPPLTSVSTPITRMGSKSGEYIVQLLQGETPSPRHCHLPVELVHRGSTGTARG